MHPFYLKYSKILQINGMEIIQTAIYAVLNAISNTCNTL